MSFVSGRLLLTAHRPRKEQTEDASVHVFIRKLTTRHPPMLNPYRAEATPSLSVLAVSQSFAHPYLFYMKFFELRLLDYNRKSLFLIEVF